MLDHDDLLTPDALAEMARAISGEPEVDYLYSDEDKVGEEGELYGGFAKPDWSPERLRGPDVHLAPLGHAHRARAARWAAFAQGYDGSQDHDLALRVGEVARRVVHVPEVLYHWRAVAGSAAADIDAKPYADDRRGQAPCRTTWTGWASPPRSSQRTACRATTGSSAPPRPRRAGLGRDPDDRAVRPDLGLAPRDGRRGGALRCSPGPRTRTLRSSSSTTRRPRRRCSTSCARWRATSSCSIEFTRPFNYSEKMNVGCLRASGDRLVFLNDDVEVISDGLARASWSAPSTSPTSG